MLVSIKLTQRLVCVRNIQNCFLSKSRGIYIYTGDTGDTGYTGDTGDTGESGDTGDTRDTGDTGLHEIQKI